MTEIISTGITPKPVVNVFISYQWKSQAKVRKLYQELASFESLNIFMDIYKIKAGMNLYSMLANNLQSADLILACVTNDYVKSKNCEREIIYADAFNKPIIPLYIEKIPIPELGSIGFILLVAFFLTKRNEFVFDNLNSSAEFKDIVDGIENLIKNNKLSIITPLASKKEIIAVLDETSINQSVIQFREDRPVEELIGNVISKQEPEKSLDEVNSQPSTEDKKRDENKKTSPSKLKEMTRTSSFCKTPLPPIKPVSLTPKKFTNYFEIHPVIKELGFLLRPKSLLYPATDKFEFEDKVLERGGEPYYQPVGWIRYGLNHKIAYNDNSNWMGYDGGAGEWAVVYHGFKMSPLKLLQSKMFDKNGAFRPHLSPSKDLKFSSEIDVNKRSAGFNQPCGLGILASPQAELAEKHTVVFIVKDIKYKMLLQCRANPAKIRIPKSYTNIRIINQPDDIRPYAILLKEV